MTDFLDRYGLRPQEKRLLVGVCFVVFVVVNIWFVWPHFHDWSKLQESLRQARLKLAAARAEIDRSRGLDGYEVKLRNLENAGTPVLPEDQAIQFQVSVDRIERQSGITPSSVSAVSDSTDSSSSKFFVQKSMQLGFDNTDERVLVNFLYNLGARSSQFRVKELDVKPAVGNYRLNGRVTIIASYLKDLGKRAPVRAATAVAPPKPGAAKTNKPSAVVPKPPAPAPGRTPGQAPPLQRQPGFPRAGSFSRTNRLHRPFSPVPKQ